MDQRSHEHVTCRVQPERCPFICKADIRRDWHRQRKEADAEGYRHRQQCCRDNQSEMEPSNVGRGCVNHGKEVHKVTLSMSINSTGSLKSLPLTHGGDNHPPWKGHPWTISALCPSPSVYPSGSIQQFLLWISLQLSLCGVDAFSSSRWH